MAWGIGIQSNLLDLVQAFKQLAMMIIFMIFRSMMPVGSRFQEVIFDG